MKIFGLFLTALLVVTSKNVVDAKFRRHLGAPNIPDLLQKVYGEVGRDRFRSTWKEFNTLNSDEQDNFLLSDLSDDELTQLYQDFETLGEALGKDNGLVDLYANFEHNLDTEAFQEMDRKLNTNHTWWGRIKKFLHRKMEKLADEIARKEQLIVL